MPFVSITPVLIVTFENDLVSPAEKQKCLIFDQFKEPKRLHIVPGKGHMNVLGGDDFFRVLNVQVEFLRSTVGK
jgi:pimeloyl-ACP methyl ester carboxylesterase